MNYYRVLFDWSREFIDASGKHVLYMLKTRTEVAAIIDAIANPLSTVAELTTYRRKLPGMMSD